MCEGFPGMRFQIVLEREGPLFELEGAVKRDLPGNKFCRVRTMTTVMRGQPALEIVGEPNVSLVWLAFTSEDIDVEHGP